MHYLVQTHAAARTLGLGVLAALLLVAAAHAAPTPTPTPTEAGVYMPFSASGRSAVEVKSMIRGHCWTGSLAVNHRGAWRCVSANLIYDPCFSSPDAKGIVLCPSSGPWSSSGVEIKLTSKLPVMYENKRVPSTSGLPWALVTVAGWKCRLATGATSVVDGQRQNYFCTGTQDSLWGAPTRRSEPWKIYAAPNAAHRLTHEVAVTSAWF